MRHGRCSALRQPFAGEAVMSTSRVLCPVLISLALAGLAACGGSTPPAGPDAPPSTIPVNPVGVFALGSTFDLHVPAAAGPALETLLAATDSPDDPSRYLVDRMIATLPDGSVKKAAGAAALFLRWDPAEIDQQAPLHDERVKADILRRLIRQRM